MFHTLALLGEATQKGLPEAEEGVRPLVEAPFSGGCQGLARKFSLEFHPQEETD